MEIPLFLAISQQEMASCSHIPQNVAWLGCHFSETAPDLTGFPTHLPENSFLIIDDSVPILNHDPNRIVRQTAQIVSNCGCKGRNNFCICKLLRKNNRFGNFFMILIEFIL